MNEEAMNPFMRPYADAGHDTASLFGKLKRCGKCGSYLIDLSEDLVYGEMSRCAAPVAAAIGAPSEITRLTGGSNG